MLADLLEELTLLSNKVRYIQETLKGTIDLRRKKEAEVTALLTGMGFAKIPTKKGDEESSGFHYLIKMAMDSVTEENVERMMKMHQEKETEYNGLLNATEAQLWRNDLDELEKQYDAYIKRRIAAHK